MATQIPFRSCCISDHFACDAGVQRSNVASKRAIHVKPEGVGRDSANCEDASISNNLIDKRAHSLNATPVHILSASRVADLGSSFRFSAELRPASIGVLAVSHASLRGEGFWSGKLRMAHNRGKKETEA